GRGAVGGQRQHEGDGVLGGGDHIAGRRVDDDDAAPGGGVDIDVVDADAGAADHVELVAGPDHLSGDAGLAAHDQRLVVADRAHELVGRQAEADVDLRGPPQ